MENKKKIMKIIFFSAVVVFAVVGLAYVLSLFSSPGRDYSPPGDIPAGSNSPVTNDGTNEEIKDFTFYYSEPEKIPYSDYFMMRILTDRDSDKEIFKRSGYRESGTINILFFNTVDNYFHLLFNKKVFILDSYKKSGLRDSSVSKIFYTVIDGDSDKDGYLTSQDNHVLYLSDRRGEDLFQVTPSENHLVGYTFLNDKNILITVSVPDREKSPGEWKKKYILFDIDKNIIIPSKFDSNLSKAAKIFNN